MYKMKIIIHRNGVEAPSIGRNRLEHLKLTLKVSYTDELDEYENFIKNGVSLDEFLSIKKLCPYYRTYVTNIRNGSNDNAK